MDPHPLGSQAYFQSKVSNNDYCLKCCDDSNFTRSRGEVVIEPPVYANFVTSFEYIEDCNRKILNYGWVEFPLAYTQVATFSVYAYFFAALFGRQFLDPGVHQ